MKTADDQAIATRPVVTRSRSKLMALAAATVVALYLCFRFVAPFLPAIVFAVTVAVVTHRLSGWVGRRASSRNAKAAICTGVVAIAFLAPAAFLGYVGVQQISTAVAELRSEETQGKVDDWFKAHPRIKRIWDQTFAEFDISQQGPGLAGQLQSGAVAAVSMPIYVGVQTLLMLFILFYLYRDEELALKSLRDLLPLTTGETNRLLREVDDTIHATIYGTVTVAMVQGAMGGFIFLMLGIPGAVLWGVVMGLLAIVPYLGTFVVWGPTAALLGMQGEWGRAGILVGWGALAIGLIDNLLYPMLVGQRIQQHTVVTFMAILGGVSLFGATGVVLGPLTVTVTFFLLDAWRERTAHGQAAERA